MSIKELNTDNNAFVSRFKMFKECVVYSYADKRLSTASIVFKLGIALITIGFLKENTKEMYTNYTGTLSSVTQISR